MSKICLVVAMSQNGVIGINNDLPWHIPADLKRFKALTTGKPVIMGRKTFDSIFSRLKKPLPDRPNIVVSRGGFNHDGVTVFSDLQTALKETAQKYAQDEIMVIGGASVYEQALPIADKLYLTIIEKDYDGDAFFPAFNPNEWQLVQEQKETDPVDFSFRTYIRT